MDEVKSTERILGADGVRILGYTRTMVEGFERAHTIYRYMPPEDFRSLINSDWKSGQKVYWEEMLGRAHFAAVASMIRALRWLSGMCTAHSSALFLPFCASFRALIESVADAYDSLSNVAISLAEYHGRVNALLQLKEGPGVLAQELEDQLIHFSHARKLSKGEVAPTSHSAKPAAEYVRSLEKADLPRLYECYQQLCQYTHPAAHSVGHLLVSVPPGPGDLFLLTPSTDRKCIEVLVDEYQSLILPLLMVAFNPGALVLKVLLYFEVPQFHSEGIRGFDLRGIPGWIKCAQKMGVPL